MIVIDCFSLVLKEGGTKAYLRSFLQAVSLQYKTPLTLLIPDLPEINAADIPNRSLFKVHKKRLNPLLLSTIKMLWPSTYHRYVAYVWEKYYLPNEISLLKPETVFHPYQLVTDYHTLAKKVVVIHDIFHWKYQERYSTIEKWIYNSFLRGCKSADEIITISQTSKDEILSFTHISPNKIHVCYEGFNTGFSTIKQNDVQSKEIHAHYSLPDNYLLAFNSPRSHKNTIAAVKVFAQLKARYPHIRLVLVGGNSGTNEIVLDYLTKHELLSDTQFITFVESIDHFRYIYHKCVVFLFLSTEEGFGLPPLEALASDTLPVISHLSSLKELFVPLLPSFNPEETTTISAYINEIISHPEKKVFEINKAKILLRKFSWQAILPLYANILSLK